MPSKPKVLVAMSGGVDSSVATALLLRQGYDCVGAFMRLGSPPGVSDAEACAPADSPARHKQGCCSVLDATDARRVAGVLGIPFYVLNFQDDFARVIDYFVHEYNAGRTPNPCVRCNDWLKFGKLHEFAESIGADFVASGHYARIQPDSDGELGLFRGRDTDKDQSYVLFGITRPRLRQTLLPIGTLCKSQVRQLAQELKLPTFNKPDSQEICFVPDQDYAGLLRRRDPDALRPGRFVDDQGHVLGRHEGYQQFTIGQRKGLRLALGKPIFVTRIDAATGDVEVGERPQLLRRGLRASQAHLLVDLPIGSETPCTAKVRYNHQPAPARLKRTAPDAFEICFDDPQSAIAPGQAAVCYQDDRVLCGGWIDEAFAVA